MDLKEITNQFCKIGKKLKEKEREGKLIERLIFDLRAERTPGRFFERLSVRIADYNKRFEGLNISLSSGIINKKITGDEFYYLKSAILIGLINARWSYSNSCQNE